MYITSDCCGVKDVAKLITNSQRKHKHEDNACIQVVDHTVVLGLRCLNQIR
jgi:hypothetical protein